MNDIDLWKKWKAGDQQAYKQLIKQLKPLMYKEIQKYKSAPVPIFVLETHGFKIIDDALRNYDPKRGVKLSTYVTNRLKKIHRHVIELQNIAYIPESRALKIGTYQRAYEKLRDKLKREPTTAELADELQWPIEEVERLRLELRADYGEDVSDDILELTKPDVGRTVVMMYYYDLDPQSKQILEYSLGLFGKPTLSTGEIAKKLRLNINQVRNIQLKIKEDLRQLLRSQGYAV